MTVKEVSKLCGVSVRTLHYYDEIGLLCPDLSIKNGYRIYGEKELLKLQHILFFRELGFPLKEIQTIIEDPSFDKQAALVKQRELLELKQEHITGLIRLVDKTLKGEHKVSFQEFDDSKIQKARKQYAAETKQRWGSTEAFKESERKAAKYTKAEWMRIEKEAEDIYSRFIKNMQLNPEEPVVQELVKEWQAHITKNYYTCSKEILAGLGEMYIADERFTKNIDRQKKGLADFMARAIKHYCN